MSDHSELIRSLRERADDSEIRCVYYADTPQQMRAAATAITTLLQERVMLVEALAWYGEQSRLARLIHSEGDAGRNAIVEDGGYKARTAIAAAEGKSS